MYFARQKFLVAGLSRSGESAAEYLLSRGAQVVCYDDAEEGSAAATAGRLQAKGCRIVHREELKDAAEECDVLVLSPGIPVDHPLPVRFRRAGKRIVGEAELGALALRCPVIAVTGTNGKTTTVTMIDGILKAAGQKSVACGNIGLPMTACCDRLGEDGIAVAEISSFQLETLSSLRPHVSVVLNVAEDHLNRHYTMENYIYLKAKLLKNGTESEYAVLNYDDETVRSFAEKTKAKAVWFSLEEEKDGCIREGRFCFRGEEIMPCADLPLKGKHNLQNALAAVCAVKLMGADNAAIADALRSFRGVAHRLQEIGKIGGITFIDDSKATNVDSALKAVGSVSGESVLLLGGKDKGEDYAPLFRAIAASSVVHAVLYGENAFRLLKAAIGEGFHAVTLCRPFDVAVRVAYLTARQGQNVLLSPAAASFDSFRNYEERGERFAALFETFRAEREGKACKTEERDETGRG